MSQTQLRWMGVPFIAAGTLIILMGAGVIEATLRAPGWIVVISGLMFVVAGLIVARSGTGKSVRQDRQDIISQLLGLVVVACFGAVFTWIGFGPGERVFSSSYPFCSAGL